MHVHHNVLFEYCYDYKKRVQVIKDCKPAAEQDIRLRLIKMLSKEAIAELPERIVKKSIELKETCIKWDKVKIGLVQAQIEMDKISAEWDKTYNKLDKAKIEMDKISAERDKACAKLAEARIEVSKVYFEWNKIYAEWKKADAEWNHKSWHKKHCGCQEWNGEEIVF